jgi:hypothetical protein
VGCLKKFYRQEMELASMSGRPERVRESCESLGEVKVVFIG